VKDKGVTVEFAQQIAVEFLKKRKSLERVEVSTVEQNKDIWVIRGTCPIDLEGHPWAEKFEVILDTKGKVKSSYFALL
jgi:transcriptional regulatory protein LevR